MRCSRLLLAVAAALLGITILALNARATSHERLTLQEVVKRADLGFHGDVVSVRNEADEVKGAAWTHVTFRVREILFDRTDLVTSGELALTFAGGRVNGRMVRMAGTPQFRVGDELLLLVRNDGNRFFNPVIGGEQGQFRIVRDADAGDHAYPLRHDGRGIAGLEKGNAIATAPVKGVRAGVVEYEEAGPEEAHRARPDVPRPDVPRPAGGGARDARRATTAPLRPDHIVDLDGLKAEVFDQFLRLPRGQR